MSKTKKTLEIKIAQAVAPFLQPSINVKSVEKEAFLRALSIPA